MSWAPDWHLICCDQDHGEPSRLGGQSAHATPYDQFAVQHTAEQQKAAAQAWLAYCCTDEACQVPEAPLPVETVCCELDHEVSVDSTPQSQPVVSSCPPDCHQVPVCHEPGCTELAECAGGDCCYLSRCVSRNQQCILTTLSFSHPSVSQNDSSHPPTQKVGPAPIPDIGMNGFSPWPPFGQITSPATTVDSVTNVSAHIPPCHHQPAEPTCPTCHVCHWQNCHRSFASVEDLLAHVSATHLGLGSEAGQAEPSSVPSTPQVPLDAQNLSGGVPELDFGTAHALACLWDDCLPPLPAPTTTPANSSAAPPATTGVQPTNSSHVQAMDSATLVLRHLLEQHLGVQATKDMLDLASLSVPFAGPPQHSHQSRNPGPRARSQSVTPPSTRRDSAKSSAEPIDFVCRWQGCAHVCDDAKALTDHVSAAHVGNGKPEYYCLWEGCECEQDERGQAGRHFASRQKIMRHLQTHTGASPSALISRPTLTVPLLPGYRPFVCEICHQAFSEQASLTVHLRRHNDESE